MLAIDIMFIEKLAILVGVSTPLGLTIAYSLNTADLTKPARTAAQVKIGINHFIAVLAAQNFRTSIIMSDGEGAVKSLIDELGRLGVEVDVSGAGGHVARIERKIRIVRERVRCHVVYHLPFTLSTVGIAMLVLYCISRLNYEPAGLREWARFHAKHTLVGSLMVREILDARSEIMCNVLSRTLIQDSRAEPRTVWLCCV